MCNVCHALHSAPFAIAYSFNSIPLSANVPCGTPSRCESEACKWAPLKPCHRQHFSHIEFSVRANETNLYFNCTCHAHITLRIRSVCMRINRAPKNNKLKFWLGGQSDLIGRLMRCEWRDERWHTVSITMCMCVRVCHIRDLTRRDDDCERSKQWRKWQKSVKGIRLCYTYKQLAFALSSPAY